uniref:Uncharacterized protein n=1 Tax=Mola mola TaxID=94237 RepID=A0A3Q3X527_MOLML
LKQYTQMTNGLCITLYATPFMCTLFEHENCKALFKKCRYNAYKTKSFEDICDQFAPTI